MHWYIVENTRTDTLKVGDVIGFKRQNPNMTTFIDGHFISSADWIYLGKGEKPPIDDILRAAALINAVKVA